MPATLPFSDTTIPVPGFGAMGMSAFYGKSDDEKSAHVLQHAIDIGCTFWDSANVYGCGHNEALIGKALKQNRDKVFVATKFGAYQFDKEKRTFTGGARGDPQYMKECLDDSIALLGFTPDLYYQHRVDPNTPIEDTVRAMDAERKAGKFKYLGLSECSADTLRRATKVAKVDCVQTEFSPWTTDIEHNGVADACRELGVAIIAYSPLGRGIMTGKYHSADDFEEGDHRRKSPRWTSENFAKNIKIVDQFTAIGEKKGVTPGQLCLAWVMSRGYIPIPGTRSEKYLDENFAARDITFTKAELDEIQHVVDNAEVAGARYPEQMMDAVHK